MVKLKLSLLVYTCSVCGQDTTFLPPDTSKEYISRFLDIECPYSDCTTRRIGKGVNEVDVSIIDFVRKEQPCLGADVVVVPTLNFQRIDIHGDNEYVDVVDAFENHPKNNYTINQCPHCADVKANLDDCFHDEYLIHCTKYNRNTTDHLVCDSFQIDQPTEE